MENKFAKILTIVLNVVDTYSKEIEVELEEINQSTRLIGSSSSFDSSDLVQIIVEIEEKINSEFHCEIILTDEKAMSRVTSPFLNIGTLVNFISENLE